MFNCSPLSTPDSFSLLEQFCFPRRIFFPLKESVPVCVCDYQFNDEGPSEVTDRLKEMLDIDAAEDDLITDEEILSEMEEKEVLAGKKEHLSCIITHLLCASQFYIVNFDFWGFSTR